MSSRRNRLINLTDASAGTETGEAGADTVSRPQTHIFCAGVAKRRRCQNSLRHTRPLQRRVHSRHLRPRDHFYAEAGGEHSGEFPLRYSPTLTAPSAGMGRGLGQPRTAKSCYS